MKTRELRLRRLLLVAAVFALFVAVSPMCLTANVEAVQRFAHVDFYDYYYAGKAIRLKLDPYDAQAAQAWAVQNKVPHLANSDYIYPAWFGALLAPVSLLKPRLAAGLWYTLSSLAFVGTAHVLTATRSWRWFVAFALFPPTVFTLIVGQVNAALLTLLVLAWYVRVRAPIPAGVSLGLASAIKLSPGLLIVAALVGGRPRVAVAAAATVAACAFGGELASPGSTWTYVSRVLPEVASIGPHHAHPVNQSVGAVLERLLGNSEWSSPLVRAPWLVRPLAMVIFFVLAGIVGWRPSRTVAHREHVLWSGSLCIAVVAAPLAWESTYLLLLLAVVIRLNMRRLDWPIVVMFALTVVQRGVNVVAAAPERFTELRYLATLNAFGLVGALVLFASCVPAVHSSQVDDARSTT